MSITHSNIRLSHSPNGRVRKAALAGSFYPADRTELTRTLESLLSEARFQGSPPKALIVPHAGYIYSGSTAALAYAGLREKADKINRVVLLGPAHRVHTRGIAASSASTFETPLGPVDIDLPTIRRIASLPQVTISDESHAQEHSIEIHLPFLQSCLRRFKLIPLVVGDASAEDVAEVLSLLWGGDETLVLISSDLSHFHEYGHAKKLDMKTAHSIENFNYGAINSQSACGCRPMNGLLKLAAQRDMKIQRLGMCNSGDTAGHKNRVVGYGAWSLHENAMLGDFQRSVLLRTAHQSISEGLKNDTPPRTDLNKHKGILSRHLASFVTLKTDGRLRGCIGTTHASRPLLLDVASNAFNSAFRDPRFPPLSEAEFKEIELSISVLSDPTEIQFSGEDELLDKIVPGYDGLIIHRDGKRATFLPSVWESLADKKDFLKQLRMKAGLKENELIKQAWRYSTESFS